MHLLIVEHCGNKFIIETMRRVFEQNTKIVITSKQNRLKIHDAQEEHLQILDLLIAEKFKEAEESMRTHIEECRRAALDFFYSSYSNEPVDSENLSYLKALSKISS